jgi:hypothetical protein
MPTRWMLSAFLKVNDSNKLITRSLINLHEILIALGTSLLDQPTQLLDGE